MNNKEDEEDLHQQGRVDEKRHIALHRKPRRARPEMQN